MASNSEPTDSESIGAYEAKTRLSQLLDEVERGRTIAITKHGRTVAKLVPPDHELRPTAEVIASIKKHREGRRLGGLKPKDLVNEGRRW